MNLLTSLIRGFLICLTFYSTGISQSITIVSWNLKDLGNSKDDKEIAFIANITRHADILLIQEVVAGQGGAQAVGRLAMELNRTGSAWDYKVSNPTVSSSPGTRERYAFIWKKHKVKLVGNPWLLGEHYTSLIEREPYLATFDVKGKSFTLVSYHSIPREKKPETEIKYFKNIVDSYPTLNLIISGDFNLPQSHTVFNPIKKKGFQSAIINQKTTLKKSFSDDCLASEFDNIFYKPTKIKVITKGVIHFYKTVEPFESARLVSDHLPVFMTFEVI